MEIKALSYSTLLYQLSFSSQVIDKGDYIVVSTPELPFYYWGNFILFPKAPEAGDLRTWTSIFQKEFQNNGCKHIAFVWDSPSGEFGESGVFEEDGFYFQFDEILTAGVANQPSYFNDHIEIRSIETDEDWEKRIELNVACGERRTADELRELGNHYRRDTEQFYSVFLGAFIKGELVGEMAVFRGGKTEGIIGLVKTHPNFRKQGVCRTLLCQTMKVGKELLACEEFVMVAEKIGSSASVYKAVGFKVVEHGACLIKHL